MQLLENGTPFFVLFDKSFRSLCYTRVCLLVTNTHLKCAYFAFDLRLILLDLICWLVFFEALSEKEC